MADLAGVYAKINRAKRYAAEVTKRVEHLTGGRRQRFHLEPDPQTGYHVLRVEGVPVIDTEWSTLVGDCIHNLRSTLDHLAWQLVLVDGKTPNRFTKFPIRETPLQSRGVTSPTQLQPAVHRADILDALEESLKVGGGKGVPAGATFAEGPDRLLPRSVGTSATTTACRWRDMRAQGRS